LNKNEIDEKENEKRRKNDKEIITLKERKREKIEKRKNKNSIFYNY
jgi:hypothetical protein